MIALIRFSASPAVEPAAEAAAAPAGIERAVRVLASSAALPKPEVIWKGSAPDAAFDRTLFVAMLSGQRLALYDDGATSAADRWSWVPR